MKSVKVEKLKFFDKWWAIFDLVYLGFGSEYSNKMMFRNEKLLGKIHIFSFVSIFFAIKIANEGTALAFSE